MEWAENDYEPTHEEVQAFVGLLLESTEGGDLAHGKMSVIPTMEHYIWAAPGIYWGGREIGEDGRIHFDWVRP